MVDNQQDPITADPNRNKAASDSELAEYNSALRNAWITCGLELDRTLLTLSAGGIGILITLLTTGTIEHYLEIVLFTLAVLFFLSTLICMIWALELNKIHIEQTLKGYEGADPRLTKVDLLARIFFIIGIIFTLIIGINAGIKSLNKYKEEQKMAEEKKQIQRVDESLNNLSSMKPITRSLNDLSSIKPIFQQALKIQAYNRLAINSRVIPQLRLSRLPIIRMLAQTNNAKANCNREMSSLRNKRGIEF